jgi:hypothetical protein
MGIKNRLQPDKVTKLCNTASEPNDTQGRRACLTSITSLQLDSISLVWAMLSFLLLQRFKLKIIPLILLGMGSIRYFLGL